MEWQEILVCQEPLGLRDIQDHQDILVRSDFQGHEESREIKVNVATTENLGKRENVEPKASRETWVKKATGEYPDHWENLVKLGLKVLKAAKGPVVKQGLLDLQEKKAKLVHQGLLVTQEDQEIKETKDNKVVTAFLVPKVNADGMVQLEKGAKLDHGDLEGKEVTVEVKGSLVPKETRDNLDHLAP